MTSRRRLAVVAVVAALILLLGAGSALTTVWAVLTPTIDVDGANDEPGQKDLTRMAEDFTVTPPLVTWNWDEIKWTGNNTGDACALFDSGGAVGNANYALCVTIGAPAAWQDTRLYTCGDTRPDRCTTATEVTFLSSCGVAPATDDPFTSGDEYPNDTKASCTVNLADMPSVTGLLDVCSYPSQQPNSDPSDCVAYTPDTGTLEVVKALSPPTDPGLFNLFIDDAELATNVGDGGTTGPQTLSIGTRTVSETAGLDTSLSDYSTSIECYDGGGEGQLVAGPVEATSLDVTVNADDDIVCTITNTRKEGVTFVKVVSGGTALPSQWSFDVVGGPQNIAHNGQVALDTGSYTVTEDGGAPNNANYDLTGASGVCSLDGGVITLTVTEAGGTCTVTNTRKEGNITFVKVVSGGTALPSQWSFDVVGGPQNIAHNGQVALDTGSHTVTEDGGATNNANYELTGASGVCSLDGGVITLTVTEAGGTCTVTNTRPCIDLIKLGPTGASIGSKITYVFRVTNCSAQTPLDNVKLSDPRFPAMGVVNLGHLDPGQSKEHIYVYTVKESDGTEIINVATATGKTPLGKVVDDADDWIVPIKPKQPPPEEQFVPEWGSLALLASALGPLAGYARMRRRKK